ncbi:MAG: hypothetical protein HXS54_01275 [Theionarchaea archaeon]|nr:hypothetical protein [Theionarchaea archaeon]
MKYIIIADLEGERVFSVDDDTKDLILPLLEGNGQELTGEKKESFFRRLSWVRKMDINFKGELNETTD